MPERFIFDTNVFIQAKNREYRPAFCAGFWQWIEAGHKHGIFFSCKKVLAELRDYDDKKECPARAWAEKMPNGFFRHDERDKKAMEHYAALMNWAYASNHYTLAAKTAFADRKNADAFVVAIARAHGLMVVSHEKDNPDKTTEVPIPSACTVLGVKPIQIYDLLSKHATSTFVFKA